jgi:hypothetical protein
MQVAGYLLVMKEFFSHCGAARTPEWSDEIANYQNILVPM